MSKCATKFCRGRTTQTGHSPYCAQCRTRRFKEKFPLKYSFLKLKYRAQERGHEFQLSFDDYRKFAVESGYADLKGKTAASLSINRKDPTRGYCAENIEAVTLAQNSRLQFANLPPHLKEEMRRNEKESVST